MGGFTSTETNQTIVDEYDVIMNPDDQCNYTAKWIESESSKTYEYVLKIEEPGTPMSIGLITNDKLRGQSFNELDSCDGYFYSYQSNGVNGCKQTNDRNCGRRMENTDKAYGKGDTMIITMDLFSKTIVFERKSQNNGYGEMIQETTAKFDGITTGTNIKYKLVIQNCNITIDDFKIFGHQTLI